MKLWRNWLLFPSHSSPFSQSPPLPSTSLSISWPSPITCSGGLCPLITPDGSRGNKNMPVPVPSLLYYTFSPAHGLVLSHPSLSLALVVHIVALKGTDVVILQASELCISVCVRELLRWARATLGCSHSENASVPSSSSPVWFDPVASEYVCVGAGRRVCMCVNVMVCMRWVCFSVLSTDMFDGLFVMDEDGTGKVEVWWWFYNIRLFSISVTSAFITWKMAFYLLFVNFI